MRLAAVAVWIVAVFLLSGSPAPVMAQQMTLPGKASVDPNGGAGYSIPISVPPGTAGLAPALSLQYNNQGGNGLLGMGWALGGLAAVGRCPATVAQDGVMGRVNYDANDRFCLDGQRLFAINGGAYGAGFTGFRQVTAADLQTNVVKTTTYRQDFPYAALVTSETQSLNGATLSTTNNAYENTSLGGTRYQVFLAQSQSSSADLNGSTLPTVTTSYQYDSFGNATQVVVSATDGHSKTTTNTYTNDTTNWLLGRLVTASVTSTLSQPGAASPLVSPPAAITISASTKNFNLLGYLTANNMVAAGVPASVNVTIAGGAVIGSTSAGVPAFDTGSFPAGSTIQITNNGTIVGAGGTGGAGSTCSPGTAAGVGGTGGPALRAQNALTVVNNGGIWGGGGGGGGGAGLGGGGAPGSGATVGSSGSASAGGTGGAGQTVVGVSSGAGGAGGGPGLAGSTGGSVAGGGRASVSNCLAAAAGGAAGPAVIGNSNITWTTTGDRRGALN